MVGYIIVRLSTAQRRQQEELAEKNVQLAHYAAALEQLTISRERNRLARDLHDTLAHVECH
jgi:signal transduction histidine kinase